MRALLPVGLLLLSCPGLALAGAPGTEPPARPAVAVYRGSESNVTSTVKVYRGSSDMGSPPAPEIAQARPELAPEVVLPDGAYLWVPGFGFWDGRSSLPGFHPVVHGRFDTLPEGAAVRFDNGAVGFVHFGDQAHFDGLHAPAFVVGPQTFNGEGLHHALHSGGVVVARRFVPGVGHGFGHAGGHGWGR